MLLPLASLETTYFISSTAWIFFFALLLKPLIVAFYCLLNNYFSTVLWITDSKIIVWVCLFVFQSTLQSSPWGLMQMLEQQVGELTIDTDAGCCDGAQGENGQSLQSAGTSTASNIFLNHSSARLLNLSANILCDSIFSVNLISIFFRLWVLLWMKLVFSLCISFMTFCSYCSFMFQLHVVVFWSLFVNSSERRDAWSSIFLEEWNESLSVIVNFFILTTTVNRLKVWMWVWMVGLSVLALKWNGRKWMDLFWFSNYTVP